ncbi:MAG: hypothetical protein KDK65_07225 [Chlamydiia bacterium]|nr:hypothetical protein [Chlamydiia bacterium]
MQKHWERHPKAETLVLELLKEYGACNVEIQELEEALYRETSTRLLDWVDHIVCDLNETDLLAVGYELHIHAESYRLYHHPGAQLPRIALSDVRGVAVSCDSVEHFLMVRGLQREIEGAPLSVFRRAEVSREGEVSLWCVERRGTERIEMNPSPSMETIHYCIQLWRTRPRPTIGEEEALQWTLHLAQQIVEMVGQDCATCLIMQVEREYWEARNHAGQLQKDRQDRLGMGWANHDHHTFRSGRQCFRQLVHLFEILGFHCRERYWAGQEAGWGAQIMENSRTHHVVFLDCDLDPNEVDIDFAHEPLPELDHVGTIGLWCGLHGESILKAGMHHLEAQFLFDALRDSLDTYGVGMMEPFSKFPYLKQAFTKGERWPVAPERIEHLLIKKLITEEQAKDFLENGAVGSHLENLQRTEGYKGFNQKNVSFIIKKTDPRSL